MSAERADSNAHGSGSAPSAPPTVGGLQFRHAQHRGEALAALRAFVRSLGVAEPADTEADLLLQAAPYMSESLDENLKTSWTPEERARLDAQPIPEHLDHTNRDHEYFFFKQMRESLERRTSRGSSSFGAGRYSSGSGDKGSGTRQPSPPLSVEEAARQRAQHRRNNLQAVWGEEGRAVLTALDALPEDVLLDADCTPPASPTYGIIPEETEHRQRQQQQPAQKQQGKRDKKFWCF